MKCCIYELYYGVEFEVSEEEFMLFIDSLKFEEGFRVEYSSDRKFGEHKAYFKNIKFYTF